MWRLFEERHLLESGAFLMRLAREAALIRTWCLFEAQPFLEHRIHPPKKEGGRESLKEKMDLVANFQKFTDHLIFSGT